jgi:uncharacterized protein involved in exopolysaccharide biosynthesis
MDSAKQVLVEPEAESLSGRELAPAQRLPDSSLANWSRYLHLLWERRGVLYTTALWALAISTVIAFLIPRRFASTVSIMPPESVGGGSKEMLMAGLAMKTPELAGMAASALGVKSKGAMFVDLLRSRTVEERIVDKFNLRHVYWKRYEEDARKVLDRRTDITENRKSEIITVTVTDSQAERARNLAQAFVEELNKLLAQVNTSSARRERIFIEQRLSAVKAGLEDAEQKFSAFASKNGALDIKEQTKSMVESAAILQGQLIAAQSELEGLSQIYTPNNVRVRSARAQVEELRRQLQQIGGLNASLTTEASQSDELYPPIRKLPLLGVEWADLYRQMKIQETVYELLNQQYELARIQEAKEIPTVDVIDPANLPEKRSWPPRALIVTLLTGITLAGAALIIIGSERIQALAPGDPRRELAITASDTLARIRHHKWLQRLSNSKSSGNGSGP